MDDLQFMKCDLCGLNNPTDLHHVKTRKSGGSDHYKNLMRLHRECHTKIHKIGLSTAADKYPTINNWLLERGWTKIDYLNKWSYPPEALDKSKNSTTIE